MLCFVRTYTKKWGINMAVIRVEKTSNYTVMSNHHLRNKDMSLKSKGLMSLMLSLPPSWDYSIGGLVAICKESHTSIRSALKELEANRYLIRKRVNGEKGYFSYEYILYEMPLPHDGNQHTAEKDTEKGHADEGHAENNRQLNKDSLITKELITNELNTEEINKENELENILISSVTNSSLRDLYKDYIEMRKEIEAPLTTRGLKMLIQRNERLSNLNIEVQKILLETATINNWKNIYSPNENNAPSYVKENKLLKELHDIYGLND